MLHPAGIRHIKVNLTAAFIFSSTKKNVRKIQALTTYYMKGKG